MKIQKYENDNSISLEDKVIGTDSEDVNKTKNYSFRDILTFLKGQNLGVQQEIPILNSGSYNAIFTPVINVSSYNIQSATYIRVGDVLSVCVAFQISLSVANNNANIRITLPVKRLTNRLENIGQGILSSGNFYSNVIVQTNNDSYATVYLQTQTTGTFAGTINFCYTLN